MFSIANVGKIRRKKNNEKVWEWPGDKAIDICTTTCIGNSESKDD